MKTTAVILAGGKGERFWPRSRTNFPKQFLSLTDDGVTMIQKTVRRLLSLVEEEDLYIVTNQEYVPLVQEQLPSLPITNIIAEPVGRNTAPCIGLMAGMLQKKYGNTVMLVLPSDHLIHMEKMYVHTLKKAIQAASVGRRLLTLGITPTHPETGYGYLQFGEEVDGIYQVDRFVEKPDYPTAKCYLDSGDYLWNSGMFIWKASSILENIKELMPDLYEGLSPIINSAFSQAFPYVLAEHFPKLPSQSIDFGIMEHASDIYTIPCSFGWDDVGSWLALERIGRVDDDGNALSGDVLTINTKDCTVQSTDRLVACLGLEHLVIVDTKDALLVCSKAKTQDIKQILLLLRNSNRTELL